MQTADQALDGGTLTIAHPPRRPARWSRQHGEPPVKPNATSGPRCAISTFIPP